MKSIAIDFDNNRICIMIDGQQGTQIEPSLNKEKFSSFFPADKYMEHSSFTWNFEDEVFSINQPYHLQDDCIMTKDCFVPEIIMPMHGIKKRYKEFISILGYEEVNMSANLPDDIKKYFGL